MRGLPSLGSLVLLAILVYILLSSGGGTGEEEGVRGQRRDQEVGRVERVVDGDTVEVVLDGGSTEDVRYIGVDTPESVKPGTPVECFGLEASHFNGRLVAGEQVRLSFDAESRDTYGRLLAYVHRVSDGAFVNAELLRLGYATTLTIAPNDRFAERFAAIERTAAIAGRGLWGECEE